MWKNVLNKQLTIYNSSANFLDPKIELTYDLKYLIFSPHTLGTRRALGAVAECLLPASFGHPAVFTTASRWYTAMFSYVCSACLVAPVM